MNVARGMACMVEGVLLELLSDITVASLQCKNLFGVLYILHAVLVRFCLYVLSLVNIQLWVQMDSLHKINS